MIQLIRILCQHSRILPTTVNGFAFSLSEEAEAEAHSAIGTSFIGQAKETALLDMGFEFGKLVNRAVWSNGQATPSNGAYGVAVDSAGLGRALLAKGISFVLSGNVGRVLGFFADSKKAIVTKYILAELKIALQNRQVSYMATNQPKKSDLELKIIEQELSEVVQAYVN